MEWESQFYHRARPNCPYELCQPCLAIDEPSVDNRVDDKPAGIRLVAAPVTATAWTGVVFPWCNRMLFKGPPDLFLDHHLENQLNEQKLLCRRERQPTPRLYSPTLMILCADFYSIKDTMYPVEWRSALKHTRATGSSGFSSTQSTITPPSSW